MKPVAMRDALLEEIWIEMASDSEIFFITADFGSPILDKIRSDFPERFVNVGVAEQNLINVSAGLALEGYKVFAYAIAPFITMRCYEQTRVSLALLSEVRNMNVNLIGVGAGFSYVMSGPTHQCYEDISIMRAMPTFRVISPSDHVTAAALSKECLSNMGPKYLRLDAQVLPVIYESDQPNVSQGFSILREGDSVCIVATGYMVHTALHVQKELEAARLQVGVIDLFDLTSPSAEKLEEVLDKYTGIVSLEEGFKGRGGLDSFIFDFMSQQKIEARLLNLGLDGAYHFELDTRIGLHERVGIGPGVVARRVSNFAKSLN
jgi:transketolase